MDQPEVIFQIRIVKNPATLTDEAVTTDQINEAVTPVLTPLFSAAPAIYVKKIE